MSTIKRSGKTRAVPVTRSQAGAAAAAAPAAAAPAAGIAAVAVGAGADGGKRLFGFEPFVPVGARVLILGSMPSVKSLEQGFYYAHPRNRMFMMIARLLAVALGQVPPIRQLWEEACRLNPDVSDKERFKVIAVMAGVSPLVTLPERKAALSRLGIALYDVVASCEREGSLDCNIRNLEYADIVGLLQQHPGIKHVITNGSFAGTHFARSTLKQLPPDVVYHALPSTSPANAVPTAQVLSAYEEVLLPVLCPRRL